MKREHTHYDNLKVIPNAPMEVIRAAYKSLAQKYHPDRNPNSAEAERIMKIINASYAVLSDPEQRQAYDATLAASQTERRASSRHSQGQTYQQANPEANDIKTQGQDQPKTKEKAQEPRDTTRQQTKVSRVVVGFLSLIFVGAVLFSLSKFDMGSAIENQQPVQVTSQPPVVENNAEQQTKVITVPQEVAVTRSIEPSKSYQDFNEKKVYSDFGMVSKGDKGWEWKNVKIDTHASAHRTKQEIQELNGATILGEVVEVFPVDNDHLIVMFDGSVPENASHAQPGECILIYYKRVNQTWVRNGDPVALVSSGSWGRGNDGNPLETEGKPLSRFVEMETGKWGVFVTGSIGNHGGWDERTKLFRIDQRRVVTRPLLDLQTDYYGGDDFPHESEKVKKFVFESKGRELPDILMTKEIATSESRFTETDLSTVEMHYKKEVKRYQYTGQSYRLAHVSTYKWKEKGYKK